MIKAYKYELAPTPEQANHLNRIMGSCRFVYNLALDTKIHAYTKGVSVNCFELMKQLTDLKAEYDWLYESPTHALQHAISNLDNAFTNFFKGRAKFPRFKSKKHKQSFHIPQGVKVDWEKGSVFLPKLKWVKLIVSRQFVGSIRNATVSKTPTGKFLVSVLVETGADVPAKRPMSHETAVGVDVGLKTFATLSDGTSIANPKLLFHSLKRLRVEQRTLKRRSKKGAKAQSKGYHKQRLVVAKLHEKVSNQRKDFLHKASTAIVKEYDTIVLEDLNVAGMVKNRHLSRAISDVGWGMFEGFIRYKCEWHGKHFEQIGRFEPSSKICSTCGHQKGELSLTEREWTCIKCETKHDRDQNAAINIRNFGLSKTFRLGTQPLRVKTGQ
ncbi:putative transposase [Spirosoma oryzae]|uniref:Putative transposase n=1 Tax=Spirosoma oryzae TaxID=1469603 RepID=A0A2T0T888_9BACT|nr:RNA-guided endonuclease TnpB family protein [Spirosoma oryzae]PRY41876.1 putative transposase [Spirosoma oryzae]